MCPVFVQLCEHSFQREDERVRINMQLFKKVREV